MEVSAVILRSREGERGGGACDAEPKIGEGGTGTCRTGEEGR